jgi:hypothetical protein
MLTASTYQKENIIHAPERKAEWYDAFFKASEIYHWKVIAWLFCTIITMRWWNRLKTHSA